MIIVSTYVNQQMTAATRSEIKPAKAALVQRLQDYVTGISTSYGNRLSVVTQEAGYVRREIVIEGDPAELQPLIDLALAEVPGLVQRDLALAQQKPPPSPVPPNVAFSGLEYRSMTLIPAEEPEAAVVSS